MLENCILYILEIIKYYLVMKNVMGFTERKEKGVKLAVVLFIILFSYYITGTQDNPAVAFIIFVIIEIVILFNDKLWKKILTGLWLVFFIAMLDEMFQMVLELLTLKINTDGWALNVTTIMFLSILVFFIRFKTNGRIIQFSYAYYVFLTILALTEGLTIGILERIYEQTEYAASVYVLIILSLIIMIVNVIVVVFLAVSNDGYKQRDIVNQEYLKQQEKHYNYLKEINEDIRSFKHDYTSHMLNIRKYNDEKSYDELDAYVKRITKDMHLLENRVSVNDGIVDAILNQYAYEAEESGIRFSVYGTFTNKSIIEPYDLCVIFSNLVKNAMDAAKESEEKYVKVYIKRNEEYINFKVENSFGGNLIKENGKYNTTKADKINHGLGLENVKRSVEKYNGNIFFGDVKHKFMVNIEIKES